MWQMWSGGLHLAAERTQVPLCLDGKLFIKDIGLLLGSATRGPRRLLASIAEMLQTPSPGGERICYQ